MNTKIHAQHRRQLMRMMGENSIAILPSAPVLLRNRDVEHGFRQDSDFYYLSGFPEPEAVIVLAPGRKQGQYILFCRERDKKKETWDGRRYGPEGAVEYFGADDAFPITDLEDILPGLMEHCESVYYTIGLNPEFDKHVMNCVNSLRSKSRGGTQVPYEFVSLDYLLHDMRLFKHRDELRLMRKAAKISVQAHINAMRVCSPGMYEYQLEAELLYQFNRNGAGWAYPSIVGGGANSCILHYTENDQPLNEGELVLIDAGAEYQSYASDITRTFPVNGRFSAAQGEIYELVLEAQEAAISKVKPGNHWNDPHEAAVRVLTKGMVELGLLKGNIRSLIKDGGYSKYYMHRTGHWLGMDVHDVGDYKVDDKWRLLEKGMVLTVEPGLYIPAGTRGVKRWWNIGVRIEDDVAVTKDGHEILSAGLPRTCEEIEAVMNSSG
ncbi:MAG: aminopeptidase P N-terminal domain-containing protein [Gammaproteobacteria bacterium]|nr:aminopeptidase P N-terminal domain-containing protein [Gammaproteobacteria bacterium]